jgi:SNF2 family DNA or RNA helicase|tara:strand:- start:1669 stop:2901 length:1233 start_codon:yes stop_codon:yes gene_type:complete
MEFRKYQTEIIKKGVKIISKHGFVYLAMEVRTGKTLTSLGICRDLGVRQVLFLTKKKAIASIDSDCEKLNLPYLNVFTINYESIHKIPEQRWDVIICDEAHSLGAFPKPNKRAKQVRNLIYKSRARVILLSGTPTPESYSQMYHQVYGIFNSPFSDFKNFYRFADVFVNVIEKKINGLFIRDYSRGSDMILTQMKPYMIQFSQKDAGFKTETTEQILMVNMKPETYKLARELQRNLVVEGKEEVVLADTPVKLMMKLHQIYSGTIKFESGNSMVLDDSKARFIKEKFKGKKIGIFYKFKEELNAIKSVWQDGITTDLQDFQEGQKDIALQIVSGREGISLRQADCLVYYNIDFSATSYWQSRDRMTTKDRLKNNVYWVFANKGIEGKIYKAVVKKKDYTIKHFKRDLISL